MVIDLPRIVDEFAERFDELPEAVAGVGAVRMLIGVGGLATAYVVHAAETTTGAVELIADCRRGSLGVRKLSYEDHSWLSKPQHRPRLLSGAGALRRSLPVGEDVIDCLDDAIDERG